MLLQAMEEQTDEQVEDAPETWEGLRSKKEDLFYDFNDEENSSQANCIEAEANDYLKNVKSIQCLHNYPTIKKLFLM